METGYTWKIMERDNFLRGQDCDSQICQSSCYLLGDIKHIFCYILPPAAYLSQGRGRQDKSLPEEDIQGKTTLEAFQGRKRRQCQCEISLFSTLADLQ